MNTQAIESACHDDLIAYLQTKAATQDIRQGGSTFSADDSPVIYVDVSEVKSKFFGEPIYDVVLLVTIKTSLVDDPDSSTLHSLSGTVRDAIQQTDLVSSLNTQTTYLTWFSAVYDGSANYSDDSYRYNELQILAVVLPSNNKTEEE